MRKTRLYVTLGCCMFATAISAWAQGGRRPGLYEVTSSMTWQKSPLPPGMQAPPGSPFDGAPKTTQVCVTQEQIDKYGGPNPAPQRGNCTVSNLQMKPDGMTAGMACTGQMVGNGTVNSTWSASGTGTTNVHFTGTMQMGPRSTPIEWTLQANSVFKGADCGSVKPVTAQ